MFARAIGAEKRPKILYLVPAGDESDGGDVEPKAQPLGKIIPFASPALRQRLPAILIGAFVAAFLFMPEMFAHASVAITIDTDVLFGSVNDWIATFLPIFAIGLGIAIALAIISIVGDSILMGLRKGAVR